MEQALLVDKILLKVQGNAGDIATAGVAVAVDTDIPAD